jgi:hypothetical protein
MRSGYPKGILYTEHKSCLHNSSGSNLHPTWWTRSTALLDAISDGSLAPGERITQEDIAEQLAVSRQPVLQALRLLKKDGFVLDAPGASLAGAACWWPRWTPAG